MLRKPIDKFRILGWCGVAVSTLLSCAWAAWGIIENFHEGWYYASWPSNLGLMLTQYLSPMLIFMIVTLISIYRPRLGGGLHGIVALLAVGFFGAFSNAAAFLIIIPLAGLGLLYWFGRPQPRRVAVWIIVGLPLLTLIVAGIGPAQRVSQRVDDGNLGLRYVEGNGVALSWAPEGPGWPGEGGSWYEAQQACQYLEEDGLALAAAPRDNWRLPTVDEAVRSMTRQDLNSGGIWDASNAQATYETTPDKESPLWNVHSQVIYWWTATEIDDNHAYIIVYDGKVWPRSKDFGPAYLGFRCVK